MGFIVAVNHQQVAVGRLAEALRLSEYTVAKALEASGYMLEPDAMDIAADTAKLAVMLEKQRGNLSSVPTMADVAESVTELDEEEMEKHE